MAKYVGGEFIIESDSDGMRVTMNCEHGAHEAFSWKALEEDGVCRRPSGWISVTERLPDKSGWYILAYIKSNGEKSVTCCHYCDVLRGFGISGIATHWMPLPSAPEVEE